MIKYPEFRSIFYYRIGKVKGGLCGLIFPGRRNLYIWTKKIGPGLYIGHGWGTVVNASSIGKNCIIYQNVTIGSRNLKEPIIGDNVVITAHAILLGDIKIGNGSKIGPGAVVVKDVPGNAVVVSPSPIIIKQDNEKVNIVLS